jgi:hypothetical protein
MVTLEVWVKLGFMGPVVTDKDCAWPREKVLEIKALPHGKPLGIQDGKKLGAQLDSKTQASGEMQESTAEGAVATAAISCGDLGFWLITNHLHVSSDQRSCDGNVCRLRP